jgi:hypothetical protein
MKLFKLLLVIPFICAAIISCAKSEGGNNSDNSDPQNEGTIANPILLTVDTPRTCKIGRLEDSATHSYYKFNINTTETYYIKGSNFSPSTADGFTPKLFSDSDFTLPVGYSTPYTNIFTCGTLNSGTTYYLELVNLYDDEDNVTFTLTISATL